MARSLVRASSQYLANTSSSPVTNYPFSVSARYRPSSSGSNQAILSIGKTGVNDRHLLYVIGASDTLAAFSGTGATTGQATGGALAAAASTYQVGGLFSASNSRRTVLNGALGTANTSTVTVSGFDRIYVGAYYANGLQAGFYADGTVSDVGVWNVALGADEWAALGAGMSPLMVRPDALVAHWPLLARATDEEPWVGELILTTTGATAADHPRIIVPAWPVRPLATVAVGVTDTGLTQAAAEALAASASTASQSGTAQDAGQALAASVSTAQQTAVAQAAAQALGADTSTYPGADLALAQAAGQALATAAATAQQLGLAQPGAEAFAGAAALALQVGHAQAGAQALGEVITATTVTATGLAAAGGEAMASAGGAAAAAPDYDTAGGRKRRWVVRNGDELLVFETAVAAAEAQRAIDAWEARQPAKPARGATNGRRAVPKAQPAPAAALPAPQQAISVPDLRGLAVGYGMQAVYDQAIALRDLERAAALWQQLRAEEEEAERMLLDDIDALTPLVEDIVAQFTALKKRRKALA